MKKFILTTSFTTVILFSNFLFGQNQLFSDIDSQSIKIIIRDWEKAWNNHDVKAFASVFLPEGEFTNVVGTHVKGRKEIEEFHAPMFSGEPVKGKVSFKNATIKIDVPSITIIKPDVVSVDFLWSVDNALSPDGTRSGHRRGLINWIMIKSKGKWAVFIMHNAELRSMPDNK
ncbi:MAG TPA: SgcJ/EcaC family oxidoreductase [Chitinophagaceae bacterium]|jgi:uncharacterized protein (TIGR02246 family)|nr:SgcJ/EcaC family oxidoreductase [Chitinophagaceae bacterium]